MSVSGSIWLDRLFGGVCLFTLNIKNFQGIKDLTFNVRGFTVLAGVSGAGKSSVRRALNFLFRNDWDKAFLRNGEKECSISFSRDGVEIFREKGPKKNSCRIKTPEYDISLDKLGKDIPEQFEGLGISPLKLDGMDVDLTVYRQRDPLFLVHYSLPDKTKILNSIFRIGDFEVAARLVKKDQYNLRVNLNALISELEGLCGELLSAQDVVGVLEVVHSLVSVSQEIVPLYVSGSKQISELDSDISRLNTQIGLLRRIETLGMTRDLGDLYVQSIAGVQKVGDEFNALKSKLSAVCKVEGLIGYRNLLQEYVRTVGQIDKQSSLLGETCSNLGLVRKMDSLISQIDSLRAVERASNELLDARRGLEKYSGALTKAREILAVSERLIKIGEFVGVVKEIRALVGVVNYLEMSFELLKLILLGSIYVKTATDLKQSVLEFENVESALKQAVSQVCPTCGRPFGEDVCLNS